MSRRQKVIVVLVKVVPVLIIVAAAALHVVRQANHLIENINQVIAAELSHTYARTVSIGKTTVTPLGTVILRDISIGESEDADAEKLLSADEIRVHYGWRGLLFGGKGAQSVREVEVLSPHAVSYTHLTLPTN